MRMFPDIWYYIIILLLDGQLISFIMYIVQAQFQMKGAYNPALKKKSNKKKNKKNFQEK